MAKNIENHWHDVVLRYHEVSSSAQWGWAKSVAEAVGMQSKDITHYLNRNPEKCRHPRYNLGREIELLIEEEEKRQGN